MSNKKKLDFTKNIESKQAITEKTPGSYKKLLVLVSVLLLTFISFYPALHNGFINQDDDVYVYNNNE